WLASARGLPTHLGGRAAHGLYDVLVAGAAAEIGREKIENVVIREVGIGLQRVHRQHEETRRAEPALERMMLDECALHRVQLVAVGEAFDRADALALGLDREHQAGLTASSSRITVHAPQMPCSQPICVPVSPHSSRMTSTSVFLGSTRTA